MIGIKIMEKIKMTDLIGGFGPLFLRGTGIKGLMIS
jgi:hypothetical protein